jgi:hypothetical protein
MGCSLSTHKTDDLRKMTKHFSSQADMEQCYAITADMDQYLIWSQKSGVREVNVRHILFQHSFTKFHPESLMYTKMYGANFLTRSCGFPFQVLKRDDKGLGCKVEIVAKTFIGVSMRNVLVGEFG